MKSQNYFPAFRSWLGACCLMLVCAVADAQSVTGTVTDSGGEPLVGASVKNMSQTGIGAATDMNGTFSLKAVKGDVISVSYTGFSTRQVTVSTDTRITIVMEANNDVLDELVVVGYGVQKKSDLTGAVASVKGEELTRQGTVDILQALQGRSSGWRSPRKAVARVQARAYAYAVWVLLITQSRSMWLTGSRLATSRLSIPVILKVWKYSRMPRPPLFTDQEEPTGW